METKTNTNIYQKLMAIQANIKAPKSQYNSFGKYKYRSAENILEALKPYLIEYNVVLIMQDEIVTNGIGRIENDKGIMDVPLNYVKATARFIDCDTGNEIQTSAFARECKHTGMSEDQCTGTASSYARKYCLNAMFLLDDTKDSDTDEMKNIENAARQNKQTAQNNTPVQQQANTAQRSGWGSRPASAQPAQPAQNARNTQNQTAQQPARAWGKKQTA